MADNFSRVSGQVEIMQQVMNDQNLSTKNLTSLFR
ncbi:unnamed protein product [Victoria cruziana]